MEYGIVKNSRIFSKRTDYPVWIDNSEDQEGNRKGILKGIKSNNEVISVTGEHLNSAGIKDEETLSLYLDLRISFTVPLSIYSREPIFSSDTLTLRRLHITNGAQRWEIEAGLSPINQTEILALFTGSGYNKIHFIKTPQLPEIGDANRDNILNGQIKKVAKAGTSTLLVGDKVYKTLKRGEFIRFGNHWKTYLVVENSPNVIKVFPNLLINVPTTSTIFYNDSVLTPCLIDAGSNVGISFDNGLVSNMTCKFVEYIDPTYEAINPFTVRTAGKGNVATDLTYADNVLTIRKGIKAIEEKNAINVENTFRRH